MFVGFCVYFFVKEFGGFLFVSFLKVEVQHKPLIYWE